MECSTGQVIAAFGRHYAVEAGAGAIISCVMRGKKGGIACGDWVEYQHTAATSGVIESIKPRSSKLYRSDAFKEKIIAANITQLIVVVAAVPSFSEELINRCLVAAESERIDVFIVLNKADLVEQARTAMDRLTLYRDLGYRVISLSALYDASILVPYLAGHASVFAGQSGMGKSTLLNALIPQANRAVGEISLALDSGCHTTTHSRMYRLDQDSAIIDSPGFQEFGLNHVAKEDLAWGFVEFRPYIGRCRFSNCRHINEPGCAIAHAVEVGGIQSRRWDFYQKFCTQI
ncbi:MAG: ribosome small subunit-dependent GTPase A [Nitrosomonas sp.]|nr:MAG: ribosome small subunit-dependent GTPase A [Nitrosomonas sp.]